MNVFAWLKDLPISQAILQSVALHPLLLVGHSIGMGVLVGIIFMLDLRILGYVKGISLPIFGRLVGLGWAGLALNFATGILMFMAYADVLASLWTFDVKMLSIIAGGVCLWLQARAFRRSGAAVGDTPVFTRQDRILAMLSLVFWLTAIATGRLIAYTAPEGV